MAIKTMKQENKATNDDPINEPFIELPLQALKIRRNLLTFSLASLAIIKFGEISGQATLLGIKGPTLTPCTINCCLLLITLYFLIYFSFLGYQTQQRWKIRSSGSTLNDRIKEDTMLYNIETDYTLSQRTALQEIPKIAELIHQDLQSAQSLTEKNELQSGIQQAISAYNKFNDRTDLIKRFQKQFWQYQKQYKINWMLEYALPVALGSAAVISMFIHIFWGPIYWPWLANLTPC
jgi:hypothetical protein